MGSQENKEENEVKQFLEINFFSDIKKFLKLSSKNKKIFFKFILGSLFLSAVFIGFKKEKYIGTVNLEFYQSSRKMANKRKKIVKDFIKDNREMKIASLGKKQPLIDREVLGFNEIRNLKLVILEDNQVSISMEHNNKDKLYSLLNLVANKIYNYTNDNLRSLIDSQSKEKYLNNLSLINSYIIDLEKDISENRIVNKKDIGYLKKVDFKNDLKKVVSEIHRNEFRNKLLEINGTTIQKYSKPEIYTVQTISNLRVICLTVAFGLFLFYLYIYIKEELK